MKNEVLILNYLQNKYHSSLKQDIISESEVEKVIDFIATSSDKYEALVFGMQMLNYPADKGTSNSEIAEANQISKKILQKLRKHNPDVTRTLNMLYENRRHDEYFKANDFVEILGINPNGPGKHMAPRKYVSSYGCQPEVQLP